VIGAGGPMDLVALYLRIFFGARPFASGEFDSLAATLGVLNRLSPDKGKRYFIVNAKSVTAANVGGKVVFGRRYYGSLTNAQRTAVAAHEFGHSLAHDNERLKVAATSVLASLAGTAAGFLATRSVLVAELCFLCFFFVVMGVLSSREASNGLMEEIQCDSLAVRVAGKEPMIASLHLAQAMSPPRFMHWPGKGIRSVVEERTAAIMALASQGQETR